MLHRNILERGGFEEGLRSVDMLHRNILERGGFEECGHAAQEHSRKGRV